MEQFEIAVCYESHSVMSNSLQPHGLYSPWNSPGQNIGVGSLSLHQGIFPTQELNPGFPHCRWILYQLSHKGSPRILERVAIASRRDLPNPGIKLGSPASQVDSLPTEHGSPLWYSCLEKVFSGKTTVPYIQAAPPTRNQLILHLNSHSHLATLSLV